MTFGTDLAALNDNRVRIVERTWGSGAAAEYQADLLVPGESDGNFVSLVRLNHCTPDELRAFAAALEQVAYSTEHQYDEDD